MNIVVFSNYVITISFINAETLSMKIPLSAGRFPRGFALKIIYMISMISIALVLKYSFINWTHLLNINLYISAEQSRISLNYNFDSIFDSRFIFGEVFRVSMTLYVENVGSIPIITCFNEAVSLFSKIICILVIVFLAHFFDRFIDVWKDISKFDDVCQNLKNVTY